jgi:ABC-type branched-subunit amino acid transport system substrate-binding protein
MLMVAACGSGGGNDSATSAGASTTAPAAASGESTSTDANGVKTGPGISADTITLGSLTDHTGVFKVLGSDFSAGHQIWVDEVNAKGGICGRKIAITTVDHGYKADQAKIQFPELEPKVAAFIQLLGSPIIAALKPDIADKQVTTLAVSWSSVLLDQQYVTIVGTTYDLEMVDALGYLLDTGKIKKGDKIGHVYIDGEYGGNGLLGSKYFAAQHGMTIDDQKVTATDTDMKGIVTKFKGDGVKAIALTTSPTQTASVATNDAGLGLNVPIVGNSPTFAPALLTTPAAAALTALTVAQSGVPFSSSVAEAKTIAATFLKKNPDLTPSYAVQMGYSFGLIMGQVLTKACAAKDLTRAGIHNALKSSSSIDTEQLLPALDYSKPGQPASRSVYIAVVDKSTQGGLKQIKALYESKDAMSYQVPAGSGS